MDLPSLVGGVLVGGGCVGIVVVAVYALSMTRRILRRVEALEAQALETAKAPAPSRDLPADVWSIVALLKLTSKDNLDALTRLSPEAALAVVKELMPQLFERRVS